MADLAYSFLLVGLRFTKLIINERDVGPEGEGELSAVVRRRSPELSDQLLGDRPVIEIAVSVEVKDTSNGNTVVDCECVGGFIGADPSLDGQLDTFKECSESYVRAVYWVLRSRLQTLGATTIVNTMPLPWDYISARGREAVKKVADAARAGAPTKPRKAAVKKTSARPKA